MDSDEENDILSYTPLKRKKMLSRSWRIAKKIQTQSQPSCVSSLEISQSSIVKKLSKSKLHSTEIQHKVLNNSQQPTSSFKTPSLVNGSQRISHNSSSKSVAAQHNFNNNFQNNISSSENCNIKSRYESLQTNKSTVEKSQYNKSSSESFQDDDSTCISKFKDNYNIEPNLKNSNFPVIQTIIDDDATQATQITNISDDYESPNIDFTFPLLSKNTLNDLGKTAQKASVLSESSKSISEVSQSMLEDIPIPQNKLSRKLSGTSGNNNSSDNTWSTDNIPRNGSFHNKKESIIKTKSLNKNRNLALTTCHNEGDKFVKTVEIEQDKVNSWLKSSFEFMTSQEVHTKHTSPLKINTIENYNSNGKVTAPEVDANIDGAINAQPDDDVIVDETITAAETNVNAAKNASTSKACVHLHFHVHTSQKLVQPTIEKFFSKSSPNKVDKHSDLPKSSTGSNSNDVVGAWKTIMNSLKGKSQAKKENKISQENGISSIDQPSTSAYTNVPGKRGRSCPFYKHVEDTNFVVDAFNYGYPSGVSAYFLTHFHYDHYVGLHKNFNKPIYCSQITANLVRLKIRVQDQYIRPLPLEESRVISGVEVTLYDANHCPGAVMFLFRLTTGKTLLHVGDFRAHPNMENIKDFWNNSLDVLYLDTTYLDPLYNFPSQEEILEKCVQIAEEHMRDDKRTLFIVGSYTIGKEKVFMSIANSLDCKVFVSAAKEKTLHCLQDEQMNQRLCSNKLEAQVHVVPMKDLSPLKLKSYLENMEPAFRRLVAIKPSGWEHSSSTDKNLEPKQIGNIFIYGVPYSEHSSYYELQRFLQFVQPKKVIPTVNNGNDVARKRMESIINKWRADASNRFAYANTSYRRK